MGKGLDFNQDIDVVIMAITETSDGVVRHGTAGPHVESTGQTIYFKINAIAPSTATIPDPPIWRSPSLISRETTSLVLAYDGGLHDGGSNIAKYQYHLCECDNVNE